MCEWVARPSRGAHDSSCRLSSFHSLLWPMLKWVARPRRGAMTPAAGSAVSTRCSSGSLDLAEESMTPAARLSSFHCSCRPVWLWVLPPSECWWCSSRCCDWFFVAWAKAPECCYAESRTAWWFLFFGLGSWISFSKCWHNNTTLIRCCKKSKWYSSNIDFVTLPRWWCALRTKRVWSMLS